MRWVQLRTLPTDADWLGAVRFHPLDFTDNPLNHTALLLLEKRLLESAENNGYPFARIWLDSIDIQPGGAVSASSSNAGLATWATAHLRASMRRRWRRDSVMTSPRSRHHSEISSRHRSTHPQQWPH